MQGQLALRQVVAPAVEESDLRHAAGNNLDPRSETVNALIDGFEAMKAEAGTPVNVVVNEPTEGYIDQLLLDCGVDAILHDGGAVDGGWRWIAITPAGDASFVVMDPMGDWYVVPEDEIAGNYAVSCGFYSP